MPPKGTKRCANGKTKNLEVGFKANEPVASAAVEHAALATVEQDEFIPRGTRFLASSSQYLSDDIVQPMGCIQRCLQRDPPMRSMSARTSMTDSQTVLYTQLCATTNPNCRASNKFKIK